MAAMFFLIAMLFAMPFDSATASNNSDSVAAELARLAIDASERGSGKAIGKHLLMFEDTSGQLTKDDILAGSYRDRFVVTDEDVPSFGYSKSAFWFWLQIDNNSDHVIKNILSFDYYPLQFIYVYPLNSTQIYHGGSAIRVDERSFDNPAHAFHLWLAPGENQYLIRVSGESSLTIPMHLSSDDIFYKQQAAELLLKGCFIGTLFVLVLYNFSIGFSVRERAYFWYAGYIIPLGVFFMAQTGLGHFYVWPTLSGNTLNIMPLSLSMLAFFLVLFAQSFFNLANLGRFARYMMRILMVASLICIALSAFASYRVAIGYAIFCTLLFVVGIVVIGVIAWLRNVYSAHWYLVSLLVFLVSCALQALTVIGVLEANVFTRNVVYFGAMINGLLLSFALADRFRLIKEAATSSLEAKVIERTVELNDSLREAERQKARAELASHQASEQLFKVNMLLNNAGEGFLSFGKSLEIDSGYSKECLELFRRDAITGSVVDLIKKYDVSAAELMHKTFAAVLSGVFDDNLAETYLSLLPKAIWLHDRYCSLKYRYVVNEHDASDRKLMIVISDQTEQKRTEEGFLQQKYRLELIVYALSNREEFLQIWNGFVDVFESKIPELINGQSSQQHSIADRMSEIYRLVHTYKSLLYQSRCTDLGDKLHTLENSLSSLDPHSGDATEQVTRAIKDVALPVCMLETQAVLHEHLSDRYFVDERMYKIYEADLAAVENLVRSHPMDVKSVLNYLERLRHESLIKLLGTHINFVMQAANARGYDLKIAISDENSVYVNPKKHQAFIHSLVHLFRNAVDHGFDTAEERYELNKPEAITLSCCAEYVENKIKLTISDDGRGIATDVLKDRAVKQGLVSQEMAAAMSHDEALTLVFLQGLSSVENVSTSSGRGIGMAALREEIHNLNGTIDVVSQFGKGTTWAIWLPA